MLNRFKQSFTLPLSEAYMTTHMTPTCDSISKPVIASRLHQPLFTCTLHTSQIPLPWPFSPPSLFPNYVISHTNYSSQASVLPCICSFLMARVLPLPLSFSLSLKIALGLPLGPSASLCILKPRPLAPSTPQTPIRPAGQPLEPLVSVPWLAPPPCLLAM